MTRFKLKRIAGPMANKIILYTIFLVLHLFSCKTTRHNKSELKNAVLKVKEDSPKIFLRDDKKIIEDIRTMFAENLQEYERFHNETIVLNMFCDTLDCTIDSINIEFDRGFTKYSEILISYFNKLSPVICYDGSYKKKVCTYDILVGDRSGEIIFVVDYGHRMD